MTTTTEVDRLAEMKKQLFTAAKTGQLASVQLVIEETKSHEERKEVINSFAHGENILHFCARHGLVDIIEWILSKGGGRAAGFDSVLAKRERGQNALHLATNIRTFFAIINGCRADNGERKEMLNAVDKDGWNMLHFAGSQNQTTRISWLLSEDRGGAAGFDRDLVTALTTDESASALHLAAGSSANSIQTLLSHCTQQERMNLFLAVDKNGWTPLFYAAHMSSCDNIFELFEHPECKMIANRKDKLGLTVLQGVILGCHDENNRRVWGWFARPDAAVISALLGLSLSRLTPIDPNIGREKEDFRYHPPRSS